MSAQGFIAVIKAKVELYSQLLQKAGGERTDDENNLIVILSRDKHVMGAVAGALAEKKSTEWLKEVVP